jgi:hypothetical protein
MSTVQCTRHPAVAAVEAEQQVVAAAVRLAKCRALGRFFWLPFESWSLAGELFKGPCCNNMANHHSMHCMWRVETGTACWMLTRAAACAPAGPAPHVWSAAGAACADTQV